MTNPYSPKDIENKWYTIWENSNYFKPEYTTKQDDSTHKVKPSYCVFLPPPNVTGTLHMGHGFQHTIQDVLIRYHRMKGYNTLWQAGTDHAGIATQIVVERQLEAKNINKMSLGREEFIRQVWSWRDYSGDTITKQMRRLGVSCDWTRERFTMDDGMSNAVKQVFIKLYNDGLIYRGTRLVNWDVRRQTAVSDLEVKTSLEDGFLWEFKYPLAKDPNHYITVATTRPETMLADVAVAVNPEDPRYKHLIGEKILLPLVKREIPIIADEYVDIEFGTGAVKITPAHDFNDYEIAKRHNLEHIILFTLDGKINFNAPEKYQGLSIAAARDMVVSDFKSLSLLGEIKPHKLMIPRGERDDVVLEPMLTNQWFMKMQDMATEALALVKNKQINFIPDNWVTTYNQWLENIQDWCISRQLWWGHRIPAFYNKDGDIFVANNLEEAITKAGTTDLRQDDDVLDTWFSSALWCFSSLSWPDNTEELELFLPSNVLVTGFDIIFFWVARMIMLTNYFTKKIPFKNVYITGLICDHDGQKMSKSKGNIIDPLDLIDGISLEDLIIKRTSNLMNPKQKESIIKQTKKDYPNGFIAFGADALRYTFVSIATHTKEIRFDLRKLDNSRNFCNKIWNAARFVMMQINNNIDIIDLIKNKKINEINLDLIDSWIIMEFKKVLTNLENAYATYRFDIVAQLLYDFIWNDYCNWYLELVKIHLMQNNLEKKTISLIVLTNILEYILIALHPIMPFITEEIYHELNQLLQRQTKSLMIMPQITIDVLNLYNTQAFNSDTIEIMKEIIVEIRNLRAVNNVKPSEKLSIVIELNENNNNSQLQELKNQLNSAIPYIQHIAKATEIKLVTSLQQYRLEHKLDEINLPVATMTNISLMLELVIDKTLDNNRLQKELSKLQLELEKLELKLNNESFIARAPQELVMRDKNRLIELQLQIAKIQNQLAK